MGIRMVNQGYQPIPYRLKKEDGTRIRVGVTAEVAAKYYAKTSWGKTETQKMEEALRNPQKGDQQPTQLKKIMQETL